jgi:signal transduction histidine kinase
MKVEFRDYIVFFVAIVSLLGAWVIDTLIPSKISITSIYTIPILIAAYRFNYKIITIFSLAAIILYSFQAFIEFNSYTNILLNDVSLIITTILAIQLTTQRLKAEQLKNKAETVTKQLEFFMNIIAHDLMQPITTIKIYAALLAKTKQKHNSSFHQNLISPINALEHLITDLQDTSRIRSGKFLLNPVRMDFTEFMRDIITQLQITSLKHKIILEAPKQLYGSWDRERLKQVFTNLLSNALKYSPEGGKIKVAIRKTAAHVTVAITDSGIGMTAFQSRTLFKPFTRHYKGKATIKGTGLGLYISKSIVEGHQGKIWVSSQKGKGTTFFTELPLN